MVEYKDREILKEKQKKMKEKVLRPVNINKTKEPS